MNSGARQGRSSAEGRRAPSAAVMHSKVRLQDLDVAGKRVLVRVDFNVPIHDGRVTDDTRVRATLPTLRHLLRRGAAVVLISHRGRPHGEKREELSLAPLATELVSCLGGVAVRTADDCVGPLAEAAVDSLRPGEILLLENLRFHAEETANEPRFAAALAGLADIYVNDAFGVSHRSHASIVGVARAARQAAAGDLLLREVKMLSRVLVQPPTPFVLVLGGAKVHDKVGIIGNLLPLVDRVLIGGAMANAFLAASGCEIGKSLAPAAAVDQAGHLLRAANAAGVELVLPTDMVVAPAIDEPQAASVVTEVDADQMALDIGPASREQFAAAIAGAQTVVWNGPMGVFETPEFAAGTGAIAKAIAALGSRALTIVGGGDTAAAAAMAGITRSVTHVSTGGGASLDLLSGAILPGVAALHDRER